MKNSTRLLEIFALFAKLGTIGFGGPPATIGMMQVEAVQKRKWVSQEYFMEMLAATNIVPGPNATEMAAHLGYIRAGLPGLLVGGISFILPGAAMSLALAVIYTQYGSLPQVEGVFHGINPVVTAILTAAFYRLGKAAFLDYKTAFVAVASLAAAFLGVSEIPIIFGGGLLAMLLYSQPLSGFLPFFLGFINMAPHKLALLSGFFKSQLIQMTLFFLKVGALLFGSTYVLIAFIQRDVVNKYHWLTYQQMLDAVVAGQITPGPISSTATFIGYLISGYAGSLLATLGMFVPSFLIVILTGKYLPRINKIPLVQYFLKGVTASAVALIAYVTFSIFKASIIDIPTAVLALTAIVLMLRFNVDAFWMIILGVVFGVAKTYIF